MSEEPLFDSSLKKRKKKTVAFSEDPLGADADPTTPAPTEIDNVMTNGDSVDMGPTTMHEQMKQNGISGEGAEETEKKEDDDFKAMFGDLKKKKKKKEIPLDLVRNTAVLVFFVCTKPFVLSYCRRQRALVLPPPLSQLALRISISRILRRKRRSPQRRLRSIWRRLRRS